MRTGCKSQPHGALKTHTTTTTTTNNNNNDSTNNNTHTKTSVHGAVQVGHALPVFPDARLSHGLWPISILYYTNTNTNTSINTIVYNPNTKIMDFRVADSSIISILRGGIPMSMGDFPDSLSQAILVGIMLVGRLGVRQNGRGNGIT